MQAPNYHDLSECVEAPALALIKHVPSDRLIDVKARLSRMTWHKAMIWRKLIIADRHNSKPSYVCPICKTPLYLLSSLKYRLYFQHMPTASICALKEKGSRSREAIRALIYGKRKESAKHKKLIQITYKSIMVDSNFKDQQIEPTVTDANDKTKRRYPDVLTNFDNRTIVFEAQVSSTFLDVIDARRKFYSENNIELFWILPSFDKTDRRIAEDDIIAQHGGLAIVANSNSFFATQNSGILTFETHRYDTKTSSWVATLTPFREIITLVASENSSEIEFKKHKGILKHLCSDWVGLDRVSDKSDLKSLEAYLDSHEIHFPNNRVHHDLFFAGFSDFGIEQNLSRMVKIIETAKTGKQFGYNFPSKPFLQIANLLYDKDPFALTVFGSVLCECKQVSAQSELSGSLKWLDKVPKVRREWKKHRKSSKLSDFERKVLGLFYPEYNHLHGKTK